MWVIYSIPENPETSSLQSFKEDENKEDGAIVVAKHTYHEIYHEMCVSEQLDGNKYTSILGQPSP